MLNKSMSLQAACVKERDLALTPGPGLMPEPDGTPGCPGQRRAGLALQASRPFPGLAAPAAAGPVPDWPGDSTVIQELDPLRGDQALAGLPGINARADTGALVRLARELLPSEAAAGAFSAAECIAAMRDLGIVAGSVKRHGVDPVRAVPGLEPVLAVLGERSGMVPRDTVYHYTTWNPPGPRRRTYTCDPQERILQDSVRLCIPRLRAAVDHCRRLKTVAVTDRGFGMEAAGLAESVRGCIDAIDLTRVGVSPEYFARGLRPYFEEITVGGQVLLGPAAAHIPLGLIDLALWASDRGQDRYAKFCGEAARYNPPPLRRLYADWAAGPSLVTRLLAAAGSDRGAGPGLQDGLAAGALRDALRALVVFRGRHLALARQAYREDVRLYPRGSGGGSLDLLGEIVGLTRQSAALLRGRAGDA
jgi:monodechloroaminopyrrolnitrin synthase